MVNRALHLIESSNCIFREPIKLSEMKQFCSVFLCVPNCFFSCGDLLVLLVSVLRNAKSSWRSCFRRFTEHIAAFNFSDFFSRLSSQNLLLRCLLLLNHLQKCFLDTSKFDSTLLESETFCISPVCLPTWIRCGCSLVGFWRVLPN